MFASRQLAAATLAVRHGPSAGEPSRGRGRDGPRPPPAVRRAGGRKAARAQRDPLAGSLEPARWSSVTRTRHPSRGARRARVAPQRDEHAAPAASSARAPRRSAPSAFAVAPRSSLTPRGMRIVRASRSSSTPASPVARSRTSGRVPRGLAAVAERDQRLADGRVDVAARQARGPQRGVDRVDQQCADVHTRPARGIDGRSSESARNREQARSSSSTVAPPPRAPLRAGQLQSRRRRPSCRLLQSWSGRS